MTRLDDILEMLVNFDGISRKFVLPSIIDKLRLNSFKGDTPHGLGEDSAAIGTVPRFDRLFHLVGIGSDTDVLHHWPMG